MAIQNELQLQITKKRIEDFEQALLHLEQSPVPTEPEAELWRTVLRNAITEQLKDLKDDVRVHEATP